MELTANSSRIAEINTLAEQLVKTDYQHSAAVKRRQKEINDMWGSFYMYCYSATYCKALFLPMDEAEIRETLNLREMWCYVLSLVNKWQM